MAEHYKAVYKKFYAKLVQSLPLTDAHFRAALMSKQLFCCDLLNQVNLKRTNAEKSEHFLTNTIDPSLNVGTTDLFEKLLQVMENSDSPTLRTLANDINVDLQIATNVSQTMLHTQPTNSPQPPTHKRG